MSEFGELWAAIRCERFGFRTSSSKEMFNHLEKRKMRKSPLHQLIYKSLFQVVINLVECPFSTRSFIAFQI